MEISLSITEQCIVPSGTFNNNNTTSPFTQVISLLTRFTTLLPQSSWGRLAITSKQLWKLLAPKSFWMQYLQMQITRVPQDFSVLKLFSILYAQRNRAEWKRSLLTTAVDDSLNSTKLLRVHVSTSGLSSLEFWKDELVSMIGLSTFPTAIQGVELIKCLEICQSRGATPTQICAWVAALDGKKRNKVLTPLLLKHVSSSSSTPTITAQEMAPLLLTMREVFDFVALLHGIALDDLRKEKWALSKKTPPPPAAAEPPVKKGPNKKRAAAPRPTAAVPAAPPLGKALKSRHIKAIALAMCKMTWLQLSDMYGPNKGLAKRIMESCHMNAVLLKLKKSTPGSAQALLSVLCLRGCPYPADVAQWTRYQEQVQEPLRALDAGNPLVKVDQRFLNPVYEPQLAGLKLRIPHSRTVAAVLSQDGNSVETWDHLLNTRGTTAAHVFQNWRTLVLLGYDADKLFAFLEKRLEGMDLFKLMAVRQVLISSFEPSVFATVRGALDAAGPDVGPVTRITMGERVFQDKKGKSTKQVIQRKVTTSFGPATFQQHLR